MKHFMQHDFNISRIQLATFVLPGKGAPVHKDRPSHGIVLNAGSEKEYIFDDGTVISVGQNEILYLPKDSSYIVRSVLSGNCYAINFLLTEDTNFASFTFKTNNAQILLSRFRETVDLWKSKGTAYHMKCKSLLYDILTLLQAEFHSKYTPTATASILSPALEFIHNSYTREDLSIPEIATRCGISEDYFRKLFKSIYGTSPRKYINELRLSYAGELIRSGLYTVTDAAALSGYTDISYFSREFKKHFGIPPIEYLRTK